MTEDQIRAIKAEYDATYARDQLTNVTEAARAMLAALKEFQAWHDCPPSLRGSGWDDYMDKLYTMSCDAIAAARAAGIGEE